MATSIAGLSLRCKRDDHSPVVMDEPLTFDATIPRHDIDAGLAPGMAWVMEQRLRLFTAQV
jgi:hypothetical protein